eukprot:3742999-Rhodomonas_salina.2
MPQTSLSLFCPMRQPPSSFRLYHVACPLTLRPLFPAFFLLLVAFLFCSVPSFAPGARIAFSSSVSSILHPPSSILNPQSSILQSSNPPPPPRAEDSTRAWPDASSCRARRAACLRVAARPALPRRRHAGRHSSPDARPSQQRNKETKKQRKKQTKKLKVRRFGLRGGCPRVVLREPWSHCARVPSSSSRKRKAYHILVAALELTQGSVRAFQDETAL